MSGLGSSATAGPFINEKPRSSAALLASRECIRENGQRAARFYMVSMTGRHPAQSLYVQPLKYELKRQKLSRICTRRGIIILKNLLYPGCGLLCGSDQCAQVAGSQDHVPCENSLSLTHTASSHDMEERNSSSPRTDKRPVPNVLVVTGPAIQRDIDISCNAPRTRRHWDETHYSQ